MSWKVHAKVKERKLGNVHRKAVMLALADVANHDGTGVYISKKRLARELEMSRNTVKKILEEFESEGLIADKGVHERYRTTIYVIALKKLVQFPLVDDEGSNLTPQEFEGSNEGAEGSNRASEGSPADPKPNNPKNKPVRAGAREAGPLDGPPRASALERQPLKPIRIRLGDEAANAFSELTAKAFTPRIKTGEIASIEPGKLRDAVTAHKGKTFTIEQPDLPEDRLAYLIEIAKREGFHISTLQLKTIEGGKAA